MYSIKKTVYLALSGFFTPRLNLKVFSRCTITCGLFTITHHNLLFHILHVKLVNVFSFISIWQSCRVKEFGRFSSTIIDQPTTHVASIAEQLVSSGFFKAYNNFNCTWLFSRYLRHFVAACSTFRTNNGLADIILNRQWEGTSCFLERFPGCLPLRFSCTCLRLFLSVKWLQIRGERR